MIKFMRGGVGGVGVLCACESSSSGKPTSLLFLQSTSLVWKPWYKEIEVEALVSRIVEEAE